MSSEEAAAATVEAPAAEAEEDKPEVAAESRANDADEVAEALEKVGVSGERNKKTKKKDRGRLFLPLSPDAESFLHPSHAPFPLSPEYRKMTRRMTRRMRARARWGTNKRVSLPNIHGGGGDTTHTHSPSP